MFSCVWKLSVIGLGTECFYVFSVCLLKNLENRADSRFLVKTSFLRSFILRKICGTFVKYFCQEVEKSWLRNDVKIKEVFWGICWGWNLFWFNFALLFCWVCLYLCLACNCYCLNACLVISSVYLLLFRLYFFWCYDIKLILF